MFKSRKKPILLVFCVASLFVWLFSYLEMPEKPMHPTGAMAKNNSSEIVSSFKPNLPTPELRHCTTNSVNPFSGSLPSYCFGAPSMAANEIVVQKNDEKQENTDISSEMNLIEYVSASMRDMRRGDFKSAMDYMELTVSCRMHLAVSDANAETKICSSQDLNLSDIELTNLLMIGVNQQDPEAEVAWANWWRNKAMVNFAKYQAVDNASTYELTDAQESQIQGLKDAFTRDMNTSKEILAQVQEHNSKAQEQLKILNESGLTTVFNPTF